MRPERAARAQVQLGQVAKAVAPFRMGSGSSTSRSVSEAMQQACAELRSGLGCGPTIVFGTFSCLYDKAEMLASIERELPGVKFHGATSCTGSMTEQRVVAEDGYGLGLLGLSDEGGRYGVAMVTIGGEPRAAAAAATKKAMEQAGRPAHAPDLVWLTGAPGSEEKLLQGIQDVLGDKVPIMGGSSADNSVEGNWWQLANGEWQTDGVVVTLMWTTVHVQCVFDGGFEASEKKGRVTKCTGRVVEEIDGRMAAAVYNEWTGGAISEMMPPQGGIILGASTTYPLGKFVSVDEDGEPYHQLIHPEVVTSEGAISVFADIKVGDELVMMHGTKQSMVNTMNRSVKAAFRHAPFQVSEVSGALVVYCAGCRLALGPEVSNVVTKMHELFEAKPFLGIFPFGEQGQFITGENRHGNLMFSMSVFGKQKDARQLLLLHSETASTAHVRSAPMRPERAARAQVQLGKVSAECGENCGRQEPGRTVAVCPDTSVCQAGVMCVTY